MRSSLQFQKRKLVQCLNMYRWQIILVLYLICFILGFIGFHKFSQTLDHQPTFSDLVYLTLQLSTLESGIVSGQIGWELEIARFLTPLITAFTAVMTAFILFHKQLDLVRLRFFRQHTIICGLGEKGWLLATQLRQAGMKVVAIEGDPGNSRINLCREMGIIVLERDARDAENLNMAVINRADYLVAVCGNDNVNAEIAVAARKLSVARDRGVLNIIMHISKPLLCDLLREREFGQAAFPSTRLEIFNVYECGAQFLISEYLMSYLDMNKEPNEMPNILIIGCSPLSENLILQTARVWYGINIKGTRPLTFTIVDQQPEFKVHQLVSRYPKMSDCCQFNSLNFNVEDTSFWTADLLSNESNGRLFDAIFICLEDSNQGLQVALELRQRLRSNHPVIILYTLEESGLVSLVEEDDKPHPFMKNIIPFRLYKEVVSPELILNGTHEMLARAIHNDYVQQRLAEGIKLGEKRSMVKWHNLPEDLRESNRRQVDHICLKLKQAGYGITSIHDWDASEFRFSPMEVEKMARMEHDHWLEERLSDGWQYAPGPEDVEKKTHPDIVPWDQLSESAKIKDRQTITLLPSLLGYAGFQIVHVKDDPN